VELSPRETRVLELLLEGKRDREIAQAMGIHYETVRTFLRLAREKLDAPNRVMAAVKFDRMKR